MWAQTRYLDPVFGVGVQYNIPYGSSSGLLDDPATLKLDLYQPLADSTDQRPLIILGHGGGFVMGNKNNYPMETLCSRFAQMGYVCASINYSLGFIKDKNPSISALRTVLSSAVEMNRSIGFLKSSIKSGNPYGIDSNQIWIGGSSAGGITGLYLGVTDSISFDSLLTSFELPKERKELVYGAISLSGAIGDINMIKSPVNVISMHGSADKILPVDCGSIRYNIPFVGHVPKAPVCGPSVYHIVLQENFWTNHYYEFKGAGHAPFDKVLNRKNYQAYMDTVIDFMRFNMYNATHHESKRIQFEPHLSRLIFEHNGDEWRFYPIDKQIMKIDVSFYNSENERIEKRKIKKFEKAFKTKFSSDEVQRLEVQYDKNSRSFLLE